MPNTALELTPQCGLKIVAILTVGIGPTTFQSIGAAQLSARPLGGSHPAQSL
jgi:hypothetical protein